MSRSVIHFSLVFVTIQRFLQFCLTALANGDWSAGHYHSLTPSRQIGFSVKFIWCSTYVYFRAHFMVEYFRFNGRLPNQINILQMN
jgi:hypothetical protein